VQDDLEREVERLKEKLSKTQKKPSRNGVESSNYIAVASPREDVCEICEQPGHDIFNCSLLKDEPGGTAGGAADELFCEDCESHGHVAANCPHSLDVF
jgi:CAP-Gly domain-containing linker protein 1